MKKSGKMADKRLEALERSVRANHKFLVRYAYRILRNLADAQDAVSELWRYAFARLDEAHMECLPILRRKLYFLALDSLRKRGRREVLSENFEQFPLQAPPGEFLSEEEEEAFAERFWRELGPVGLTDEQKFATWLALRFGYTYDEIAARLGSSRSTVGDWVAKGKLVIRKALE